MVELRKKSACLAHICWRSRKEGPVGPSVWRQPGGVGGAFAVPVRCQGGAGRTSVRESRAKCAHRRFPCRAESYPGCQFSAREMAPGQTGQGFRVVAGGTERLYFLRNQRIPRRAKLSSFLPACPSLSCFEPFVPPGLGSLLRGGLESIQHMIDLGISPCGI